jgi:gliding motility-associated-like protein
MMIVNGAGTPNTSVWCETINVLPNTNYAFSCWVASVAAGSPAVLQFSINGNTIGSSFNAPAATCQWAQFYSTWNSGSNTTANICIVNQNTTGGGNDFALDDINFVGLCDATDTVVVTVHNPTTTNVDTAVCNGVTYTFPDGTTSTVSVVDTALLTDRYGCDSSIITNLTVNPTYNPTVYDTICAGGTYTLPSGTTVNTTGSYTSNLTTISGCDSIITTNLTVNPASTSTVYDTICRGSDYYLQDGTVVNTAGSYPVTLTNQYGCDSIVTTVLTVIGIDVTAQVNNVPCNGEAGGTITVTATNGLQPYTYSITSTGNVVTNSATNQFNNVLADDYLVTVLDDFGCSTVITTTVTEPPLLVVGDTVINVTCYNDDNGQVIVTASGGTPNYIFSLTNQADNQSGMFSGLTADDYTYTVTDANGCFDTATVTVTQPNEIIIALNPDSVSIDLSESAQLLATTNYDPTANYNWSPANGLSCTTCPNPVATINRSLVYSLEVSVNVNGNNCYAYASVPVTVIPNYDIYIPNAFTPNGNGQNDFFRIYGNLPAVKYVEVAIFDRIGEMVFQTNDVNFEWDGVYKGTLLQPGVYVYTIRVVFIDSHAEKLFKGSITLLR